MASFEAKQPYKSIFQSFCQEWIWTIEEIPLLFSQGITSMSWILEAAGLNTRGLLGLLRLQGLLGLYLLTLRVWVTDDTPELEKTMVCLDKGLSRLEKIAETLHTFEN